MTTPTPPKPPKPPPKRQRHADLHIRLLPDEKATAAANANNAGLSLGAFARAAMLGSPGLRAQRRPPADHKALRQILGQCGSIGNNINQIARHLNTGGNPDIPEIQEACRAYLKIRDDIFKALNMKPPHGNQGKSPGQR